MAIWPIICHYSVHSVSEACSCLAIVVAKSGGQSLLTLLLWLQTNKIFRKQGISTSCRM